MQFQKHSGLYTLTTQQVIPATMDVVWKFFSNPGNLNKLTPGDVGFNITSPPSDHMYAGQIITYRIKLFPLYSVNWVTEITQVKDRHFFIDEQRFGPYAMWHHEHIFEAAANGVLMTDRITLKLPYGIFGRMAYPIFIKKKLTNIFQFRRDSVDAFFGSVK
jgi:ligand-binding SRPBCC domain-containing protein